MSVFHAFHQTEPRVIVNCLAAKVIDNENIGLGNRIDLFAMYAIHFPQMQRVEQFLAVKV